jgi:hypothetical protein
MGDNSYVGIMLAEFARAIDRTSEGAVTNQMIAQEQNISFANCDHANKRQNVIIVRSSNIPSIIQSDENPSCYYLNTGNCQQIETVEKFILAVVAQSMGEKL